MLVKLFIVIFDLMLYKHYLIYLNVASFSSRKVAADLGKVGIEMFDAPVSNGEPKTVDGTISVMVGASRRF